MAALGFVDMLEARVAAVDSLLCVGLDPHSVELPEPKDAAAAEAFCARLIDATSDVAAAYKPNAAFFEALGAPGVAALRAVIARVPAGIPVLLDNKRGDIGSTSAAYATASYDALGAHAVTINGCAPRPEHPPRVHLSPRAWLLVLAPPPPSASPRVSHAFLF